ncbi:RHS repeat domain-containing protein [Streptacidiphilus fuscans]|uniref:Intein C-terminal splicing domain-containing protein n=1 Tax=Streptacidiphilus fuscans TaxID=2789292 RepID=A0A931B2N5_9ACTN|nr:RHS repeat-associated core domain-containing protein [Streptacidiphilus fuscans]MBF9069163.1 hypothetical protein [Streptacidiphilus fuscans]
MQTAPVPVTPVVSHYHPAKRLASSPAPKVTWPTGQGTVAADGNAVPTARTASPKASAGVHQQQAGTLPVWLTPSSGVTLTGTSVRVLPQTSARAAGISGVLLSVTGLPRTAHGKVRLDLGYKDFAGAFGADWASRLRLVQLPACALTTPQLAACRTETPLAGADSSKAQTLSADLALTTGQGPHAPTATAGLRANTVSGTSAMVLAASSDSGGGGDFSATSLKPSGSWQAGGSTDSFTWTYPIKPPSVPGGLAPNITLGYDSQSVDGLTSSTNNQASVVGDGFALPSNYVERSYQSCHQNPSGTTQTWDNCWSSDNQLTLSLNGTTTALIKDDTTGTYRAQGDSNERVEYLTGASNGAQNGEYFRVTTSDGTQYTFGLNQLPGWSSGDTATNSVLTEPVYATTSGQPCYNSTWANSWCQQGYRWMLDYVKDTHGDVMSYFYTPSTNYYARDLGTTANTPYIRDAALQKIQYGQRDGSVYTTSPAGQVLFTYNGRCNTSSTGCATSTLTSSTASNWPDVPYDLNCANGASCTSNAPSFWSENELASIQTQALVGTTETNVDSWAFTYSFPATGDSTSPSLWLNTVTNTGQDTSAGGSTSPIAMPPVSFSGTPLSNRVNLSDGYPPITRYRLNTITTETGEVISVGYSAPACANGTPTDPSQNTTLCYPDYWTPSGQTSPIEDWFNKYIVKTVTEQDPTGGGVNDTIMTSYTPVGSPAWHYNDNPLTPSSQRTWDQWHGYGGIKVSTGTAPDPVTETDYTYFRGMDGDTLPNGGTRSVTVTDSRGDTPVTDLAQYAGKTYEVVLYNGWGSGKVVTDTVTDPWSSSATATHTLSGGLPSQQAFITGTADTKVYTPLASGSTRQTETDYTHDAYGRVTTINDQGDVSTTADDLCTTTTYADNTSAWILDLVAETRTVSANCSTTPTLPANAVSDKQVYYDGSATLGAAPSVGDPTSTMQATSYNGSTPVFSTMSTQTVDEYGRPVTSADADQRTTHTAYTPATGAAPTNITVTDPLSHTLTQSFDPLRGLVLSQTDASGFVTSAQYDALGRRTAVFKPGIASASAKYSYTVSATAPSSVTTQTLNDDGTYRTSELLLDSMLRGRETQVATVDGGRTVTDTVYNTDGWVAKTTDPYYSAGAPSATLVQAQDGKIPSETGFVYDGAGRKTSAVAYALGTQKWLTTTVYGGNFVTTIPPTGGVTESTLTDARGRTTDLYQYHASVPADPVNDPASDYSDTHYTYNPAGQKASELDSAGNSWTWQYDLLGNQIAATDPDAGSNSATYDNAGQVLTTTDARGDKTSFTYDLDGRRTAAYDITGTNVTPAASNQIAAWTYDTLKKGLLTSSTSYALGTTSASVTDSVLSYTNLGNVAAQRTTLSNMPSSVAALTPSGGYTTSFTYKSTGTLATQQDPAEAGLPSETLSYGYDQFGQTTSLASTGTTAWTYLSALGYDEYGQPLQYTMGPSTSWVALNLSYDPMTSQPLDAKTSDSSSSTVVDDTSYAWSSSSQSQGAGLLTQVTDSQNGGAVTDTQCFTYDWAARLSAAWTATDNCAATPASGSSSTIGGPNPYWQSWTYTADGQRQTQTDHDTSGNTANDTTTNYNYPTAGSATDQPHSLTNTTATGPGAAANTASYTYDASGNTTSISGGALGNQSLTWNHQNKLLTDAAGSSSTSYVYDVSGNLVMRIGPSQATLFLGDAQLVENLGTQALSGTRYYTVNNTIIAARSSSGDIQYLIPNRQGTDTLSIDYQTQAVTRRQFLPFGGARGTVPSNWIGSKGYVGGLSDSVTNLENLGSREYDAQTGRFISLDPYLEQSDPNQMSGYDYSSNDPVTGSDPTGEDWFDSLSNAASNFVDTAQQVMSRTSLPMFALGLGEMALGAGADALAGGLCATGAGCVLGAAVAVAGTAVINLGAATVVTSVAAPNIAYAVQESGSGGGDSSGSDSSGQPSSSGLSQEQLDGYAQTLVKEHRGGGDGTGASLTEVNAYKALEGGPEGTDPYVGPVGDEGPDVEFRDRQGNVVLDREVKVANGTENSFRQQLKLGYKKLDKAGAANDGQIFIQVPKGSDAYQIESWVARTMGRTGGRYAGSTATVVDDTGASLGTYDLGTGSPIAPPSDASEGTNTGDTYTSTTGFSY